MGFFRPSCQAKPTINIFSGIISSTVSRSSKMARIRALRNTQVADRPAAASMENSTPAEVGAANRPASNDSFHSWPEPQSSGGASTRTKYTVHSSHGNAAAVAATT